MLRMRRLLFLSPKSPRHLLLPSHRLVGLVVKASASRAEDPGFESRLRRDFFRGWVIPVATLPGAWCYRVIAGTGWPGVSIL